jgi:hypothetical protein
MRAACGHPRACAVPKANVPASKSGTIRSVLQGMAKRAFPTGQAAEARAASLSHADAGMPARSCLRYSPGDSSAGSIWRTLMCPEFRQRKPDGEHGAQAQAPACGLDAAAVEFDQVSCILARRSTPGAAARRDSASTRGRGAVRVTADKSSRGFATAIFIMNSESTLEWEEYRGGVSKRRKDREVSHLCLLTTAADARQSCSQVASRLPYTFCLHHGAHSVPCFYAGLTRILIFSTSRNPTWPMPHTASTLVKFGRRTQPHTTCSMFPSRAAMRAEFASSSPAAPTPVWCAVSHFSMSAVRRRATRPVCA